MQQPPRSPALQIQYEDRPSVTTVLYIWPQRSLTGAAEVKYRAQGPLDHFCRAGTEHCLFTSPVWVFLVDAGTESALHPYDRGSNYLVIPSCNSILFPELKPTFIPRASEQRAAKNVHHSQAFFLPFFLVPQRCYELARDGTNNSFHSQLKGLHAENFPMFLIKS